ncbi:MAG TPA: hypothetical protein VF326_03465 [Anaerolineaceae bacterium]|jgi:hypothetical protein
MVSFTVIAPWPVRRPPVTNGGLVVTLPSGQVSTIHLTVKP